MSATSNQQTESPKSVNGKGVLEIMPQGFGFLRRATNNYLPASDDIYLAQSQIKRFGIREGAEVEGPIASAKQKGRGPTMISIDKINSLDPELHRDRIPFKELTCIAPEEKFNLELGDGDPTIRIIDLLAPIGLGQRSLIVSPPRAGKTVILQRLAQAIEANHPECHVMMVLIDERPEEVTDMRRSVKGEVIASSMDRVSRGHVRLAEVALERVRRLVEDGRDVVVFLDSLTRMARAYNREIRQSGRTLSGGLDARTMEKPREFFGSARNIEEGGSLTIAATVLVDTGSRMDQVIFEEFKGTGNQELVLNRDLADRRVFPAIDIEKSGTRKEERMRPKEELDRVWLLRRVLSRMNHIEAMEMLIDRVGKYKTNAEFLMQLSPDR